VVADNRSPILSGGEGTSSGNPNVKIISERDYLISGCAAHSFVISTPGLKPEFRRIDYFLVKPDLDEVMFTSATETELSGATCKQLYDNISIKPKTR